MSFENLLQKSVDCLKKGGVILYPTDTIWGIGCDATNEKAIRRIYTIKKRENSKAMICLVANRTMLKSHIDTYPKKIDNILETVQKPTTIIYPNPKGIAQNIISEDNTIAIRIPKDSFCKQLLTKFKKPIISTSANISGKPHPQKFSDISISILENVDYTVNLHKDSFFNSPSSILKIDNNDIITIRQ